MARILAEKPGSYWTDQIEQVSTEEAVAMALRLAREEGLPAGTSTGGNVVASPRLAEQLGPESTVVTVMCDTGMKYLSSAMFQAPTSSPLAKRLGPRSP